MNLDPIIRAVQTALDLGADGRPGTDTWTAIYKKIVPGKKHPEEATRGRPGTRDFFGSSRKEFLPASCSLQERAKEYQRAIIWAGPGSRIDLKRPGSGSGFGRDAGRCGHARAVFHVGIG